MDIHVLGIHFYFCNLFREIGQTLTILRELKKLFLIPMKLKKLHSILRWKILFLLVSIQILSKCIPKLQIQQAWVVLRHQNSKMLNQVCVVYFFFCSSFYFYKYFAGTKPFNSFSSCTLYIFLLVINILTWYMVQHMITKQVPGYNLFLNYYSLRLRRSMLDSLMHSIQCHFQVNFFPYISKSVCLNGWVLLNSYYLLN